MGSRLSYQGQPAVIGMMHDITERTQYEEALRESEEELRALVDVSAQIVWKADAEGRVVEDSLSWRAYTGQCVDEWMESGWVEAVHPGDRKQAEARWRAALASETPLDNELRVYHAATGAYRWTRARAVPLYAEDGAVRGWIGMNADIDERKQQEAALKAQTDQIRDLAARLTMAEQTARRRISDVLHDEIQQLLFGAELSARQVRRSIAPTADPEAQTATMRHLDQLDETLEAAIHETRTLSVELSPPVLQEEGIEEELTWLARHMKDAYDLEVDLKVERDFRVSGRYDRVLLFQVARELLFNVVEHAGVGRATVTLYEAEGRPAIRVADEGKGFDPSVVATNAYEGAFGLAAARERLELLGGRLEIESAPGEGTCVTAYAPLGTRRPASAEDQPHPPT